MDTLRLELDELAADLGLGDYDNAITQGYTVFWDKSKPHYERSNQ